MSKAALLIGLATLIGVGLWAALTAYPCSVRSECLTLHQAIQSGTASSPWRYRVLLGTLPGHEIAFAAAHGAALATLYALLYSYTRSVVPILLVAGIIPSMFAASWGWVGVMTIVEAATWAALLLLARRRERNWVRAALIGLVVFAALNRETAVFLGVLWLLLTREWRMSAVMVALAAAVFVGLRLTLGAAPDSVPIADAWRLNTAGGWHTQNAIVNLSLVIPALLFALAHRGDMLTRRAVWIAVLYIPVAAIFGLWNETRLLLPVLAVCALRIQHGDTKTIRQDFSPYWQ